LKRKDHGPNDRVKRERGGGWGKKGGVGGGAVRTKRKVTWR